MKKGVFKKAFKSGLFLLCPLFSFACSSSPAASYEFGELNAEPLIEEEKEGYKRIGEYAEIRSNGRKIDSDFSSIFQSGNINFKLPSLGEVPFLVIPLDFNEKEGKEEDIRNIDLAFNGDKNGNQYVSVKEYYALSSNDRLHLKPFVLPLFFRSPTYPSIASLKTISSSSATTSALAKIYDEALSWLSSSFPEIDVGEYSFASEKGKRILPVYFVYNAPYDDGRSGQNRSSMLWAFTMNRPAPISWSSIDMLHLSQGKVDAHTYIHETGHMLGLEDYYDSSSTETFSRISHLGRMDMMDCSLGDHNAFSKMLLGWGTPYVPVSDCEITIHQGSGNNESILFAPSWNGTIYDSYLLFEFYTPSLLNRVDAFYRDDKTMRLFQNPGVKVYKIDASLYLYNGYYSTGNPLTESNYNGERLYFGKKNSSFLSPLIQLLNKHQNTADPTPYFIAGDHEEDVPYYSDNVAGRAHISEALFYEGEGIDGEHFSDIRIKGEALGCSIKIKKLTSSYATIAFDFA